MNRGDVPFYFKFVSDNNLYWLNKRDSALVEASVGIFQRDIERHGKYEAKNWAQGRTGIQALTQGLLYALKHFNFPLNLELAEQTSIKTNSLVMGKQIFKFEL